MASEYTAENIQHLENIEHVRKRPETYIGDRGNQGLHHLVKEVVDNCIDEALAGYCTQICVTITEDGAIDILDNGRGIPTGIHPETGIPTPELIVTRLGAGGKFDGTNYKVSGGLNGMGVTCVNALSEWFELEIYRDGLIHNLVCEKGIIVSPYNIIGKTEKTGTRVSFRPDAEIFPVTNFSYDLLRKRFRESAYLNSGLEFSISDERADISEVFRYDGGLIDFVKDLNENKTCLHEVVRIQNEENNISVDIAFQFTNSYTELIFSFANNINTIQGGTHLTGFKTALTRSFNFYAKRENLIKDNPPSGEDFREGLTAVISVLVPQPQFEAQTKVKLSNSDVQSFVEKTIGEFFQSFSEENPSIMRLIVSKANAAKQAREAARRAREMSRRKTVLSSGGLPDKLADCISKNVAETEVFIVEGDSAGGSARQARDRFFQAILPIQGKILNVEKAREDRILKHSGIEDIIFALGTGFGTDVDRGFDAEKVRYGKIIIMTDADVDGSHIRTLLLTFFYRQMANLVERGGVYVALPPLYLISIGKGKAKKDYYVHSETELEEVIFQIASRKGNIRIGSSGTDRVIEHEEFELLCKLILEANSINSLFQKKTISFKEYLCLAEVETGRLPVGFMFRDGKREVHYKFGEFKNIQRTYMESEEKSDVKFEEFYQQGAILQCKKKIEEFGFDFVRDFFGPTEISISVELETGITKVKSLMSIPGVVRQNGTKGWPMKRFKGLGEMNPIQLWETTMDPKTRTLLSVKLDDAIEANRLFEILMGEKVEPRREFIQKYAREVEFLDV